MRMSGTVRLLAVVLLVIVAGASVRPTAAQEYTIGPGDVLKVTGWGHDVLVVRATPGTGSSILRFDLRKIQAGDTKENIFLENGDMMFVPKASAIFVLGEVGKAGTFPLDKETSVLEAITLAGGFANTAAPAGVQVLPRAAAGRQETISLDLAGAVPRDKSFRLEDGDTVLVPKGNTFFVFGEVKKPGAYQLDKETNVLEGITIAGGFTDKAAPGRTRVIRITDRGQQTLSIDMNDVIRRGQRDKAIRIIENDVIVVPESFF